MKTAINPAIELILREFKAALQALDCNRLNEIILYGSYAQGDYKEESDIDLMVLLDDDQVNTCVESRKMMNIETDFLLRYGLQISSVKYRSSTSGVYPGAREEGMFI